MHTEAHRDDIRQARHFIYISGTGGKDGSINRDMLDDLLRLPTRNAHNTEMYKDVINELKTSPEITRLVDYDNDHVHMVLDDKNQFSLFFSFFHLFHIIYYYITFLRLCSFLSPYCWLEICFRSKPLRFRVLIKVSE